MPDGISMAKSLGGGFPIGAFWVREPFADLLSAGTHATTFGGTPLGCAVALKILAVIEREQLAQNARTVGEYLKAELLKLAQRYPGVIKSVRGLGLMIGIELGPDIRAYANQERSPAICLTQQLHATGVITIPSGQHVIRLLPPLNLRRTEAEEGLKLIEATVAQLA